MKKADSFSLKFYILPLQPNGERVKIYLRIIIDRQKAEMFTGFSVDITDWDPIRELLKAKADTSINEDLVELKSDIVKIKRRLQYTVNLNWTTSYFNSSMIAWLYGLARNPNALREVSG